MKKRFLSILLTLVMVIGMLPTVALAAATDFTSVKVGGETVNHTGTDSGTNWTYTPGTNPELYLTNYQGGPIVIEADSYTGNALNFIINVSGNCSINSLAEPYAIHLNAPNAASAALQIKLVDGATLKVSGNTDGIGVTTKETEHSQPYLNIIGPTTGSAAVSISAKDRGVALNTKEVIGILDTRGGWVNVSNNVYFYATGNLYAVETGAETDWNYNESLGTIYEYSIPSITVKGGAVVELYSKYAALNAQDVEYITKPDGHVITTKKSGDIPTYVKIAPADYVAVEGLSLNPTSLELDIGDTETLTPTVTPNNATNKDVTWTSSNPAVATVDATGKVTAVAAGSANIVARTAHGDKAVWCAVTVNAPPATYTISFASNGFGTMTDVSIGEAQNYKYTLPTSTFSLPSANYQFAHWAVPGVGEKQPGDVIDVTSDMTIVAVHQAKDSGSVTDSKYTVTYTDGVDDDVIFDTQTFSDKAYGSVTPTFNGVPERVGYTFTGWSPAVASHVTEDATYKATWEINKYEVSFWTYEGSGSMSAVTKNYDEEYTLPACGFTAPTGKSFDSWSINGVKKNPGDKITVTSNVVVNAVWKNDSATTYTIVITDGVPGEDVFNSYAGDTTYVKNSNGDFVAELNAGDAINGPFGNTANYQYDRNGYDFAGWSPELELFTTTATGNVTYTATWTPKEYTIAFWSQYGTESMSSVNKNTGDEFTFPECEYTPPNGFAFSHWTISTVNGTQYKPGDTITIDNDTIPSSGSSIQVTANWQNAYILELDGCKANGTNEYLYHAPGTEIYLVANDPQPGKVFDKWIVTAFNTVSPEITAPSGIDLYSSITTFQMPAQGIRLTATYKDSDAPYMVTLITNGGTIASGKNVTEYNYGAGATLPTDADITREGYIFNGWYDNADLDGTAVTEISTTATGDKFFYAKWTKDEITPPTTPTTYTVTVIGGEGSGEYKKGDTVTITGYAPAIGYEFDKWEVNGVTISDLTAKTTSFTMPDNEVTVTATYKKITVTTYTVAVGASPAEGGTVSGNGTYPAGVSVTVKATANSGYTFKHWTENGSPVSTDAEYTFTASANRTLVAVFEADAPIDPEVTEKPVITTEDTDDAVIITATGVGDVKLYADGDEVNNPYIIPKGEEEITVTFTATAQESGKDISDTATLNVTVPVKVVTYTITFDANGGSVTPATAETGTDGKLASLPTPTRNNYSFNGWYTAKTGGTKVTTSTVFTDNTTIYAQWTYTGGSGGIVIPTVFPVTVKDSDNGDVTASSKYAAPGTTVKLTVTPDEGYELDTLTVKYGSKEVQTTLKNGKYQFTMPFAGVTVTATFKKIETPVVPDPVVPSFDDVAEDTYYFGAVEWAVENGITTGTSDTTFSPDMTCTRAQAVTFLWRAAGSPEPKSNVMPFEDVAAEAYYYKAVLWAVENGITNGTSATTFSPNADCTRAQIVTFLWRSQKSPAITAVNPFADVAAEAYYYDAVLWAVDEKITNGTSETTFSPDADCTRAQIVTFLYRCLGDK